MNAFTEFSSALSEGGAPQSEEETKVLGLPPLPDLVDRIQRTRELGPRLGFAGVVDTSKLAVRGERALALAAQVGVSPRGSGRGLSMRLRGYKDLIGSSGESEAFFYVKGPRVVQHDGTGPRMKVREEFRSRLPHADLAMWERFLSREYGLDSTVSYGRWRVAWTLGGEFEGAVLDLDHYPHDGVAPYLEIEAPQRKTVSRILKVLGLEGCETSSETGRGLFKRLYPGIHLNEVRVPGPPYEPPAWFSALNS